MKNIPPLFRIEATLGENEEETLARRQKFTEQRIVKL